MEVAVAPGQKLVEGQHVIKICANKSNPACAALIGGLVLQDSFRDHILQFKGNPYVVKGMRHGLNDRRQLEDGRLIQNLRLLGRMS